MSSGEQTCQHPPRECPCPPGALTPQTICSGLRDRASGQHIFLYRHSCGICFTWLPVACLLFLSVCDCRQSVFHVLRKRRTKQCGIWQFVEMLDSCAVLQQRGWCLLKKRWLCFIQPRGDVCQRGIPVRLCVSLQSKWLLLKQTQKMWQSNLLGKCIYANGVFCQKLLTAPDSLFAAKETGASAV